MNGAPALRHIGKAPPSRRRQGHPDGSCWGPRGLNWRSDMHKTLDLSTSCFQRLLNFNGACPNAFLNAKMLILRSVVQSFWHRFSGSGRNQLKPPKCLYIKHLGGFSTCTISLSSYTNSLHFQAFPGTPSWASSLFYFCILMAKLKMLGASLDPSWSKMGHEIEQVAPKWLPKVLRHSSSSGPGTNLLFKLPSRAGLGISLVDLVSMLASFLKGFGPKQAFDELILQIIPTFCELPWIPAGPKLLQQIAQVAPKWQGTVTGISALFLFEFQRPLHPDAKDIPVRSPSSGGHINTGPPLPRLRIAKWNKTLIKTYRSNGCRSKQAWGYR